MTTTSDYAGVVALVRDFVKTLLDDERSAIMGGTAARAYRVEGGTS